MGFVIRVIVNGIAIWLATLLLPGMVVVGSTTTAQEVGIIALIALIFGIVNTIVKPIVALLSLPLYILTLGLFTVIVNALMLLLTAWITSQTTWGLRIDNFGTAIIGALIVSVVSFGLNLATGSRR